MILDTSFDADTDIDILENLNRNRNYILAMNLLNLY